MPLDWAYVAIFALVGAAMAALPLAIVWLIAPRSSYPQKRLAYESGVIPFGTAWTQVNVRYYLFSLVFLLFDVEVVFIYPWTVVLRSLGMPAFIAMAIFLVLLTIGLLYEWKKGALEWA
ncbi:MAG: NAD(P)H-quinone oxidoreductase subunit 3 [Armatimonadetes bacterium]|nr:NAD(P)H-quinone oxidoreductase subunit 3 [Armatimonadota bacterium]